jgi:transposase-like protein
MVGVRRLEVITGVGGRRAWSHEDKGRIVAESFAAGANVSAVARRYGCVGLVRITGSPGREVRVG